MAQGIYFYVNVLDITISLFWVKLFMIFKKIEVEISRFVVYMTRQRYQYM